MSSRELEKIGSKEVQDHIVDHEKGDVQKLLLQRKEIFELPVSVIADQIIARRKVADKIPLLYHTKGIVYPPTFNLSQSSSETTALFKTRIFSEEINKKKVADLTGGFGIDSLFFSKHADQIEFVEPNEALLAIVQHNFKILNVGNVNFHSALAESFLSQNKRKLDLIYLDPSRRDSDKRRVFRLQDCSPNISEIEDLIFERSDLLLIKTSPLLDISEGLKVIPFVRKVVIVSVDNDCKELLFLAEKEFQGKPLISTFNLTKEKVQEFLFYMDDESEATSDFSEPLSYLYEPNASVLKSGAFKSIGKKFQLKKIHPNTHIYTSLQIAKDFPGRIFKVENEKPDLKKEFPDRKANVITRNYPMKSEELRKKLNLIDGGEKYVIAFSGTKHKYTLLASKVE